MKDPIIKLYICNETLIADTIDETDYCPIVLMSMPTMSTSGQPIITVAGLSAIFFKLFLQKKPVHYFYHAEASFASTGQHTGK
jgi:hypothetical protein